MTQSPEELILLAERVEALSGPDREVDRDIMLAAVPCDRAPFRYWAPMNEDTGHGAVDVERVYYAPHCAQAVAVPAFTASLDAALSLVPAGWAYAFSSNLIGPGNVAGCQRTSPYAQASAEAATPALALTAAALRCRATRRGD